MNKKAILATDLSEAATVLLKCTEQYKALGIGKITLFHALGVQYMNFSGYVFLDKTKAHLEAIKKDLEADGFQVEIVIKEGLAYLELVEYGKQNSDDLLILGTQGMGFMKGILLGSTADQVIRRSKNPVLLIQCLEVEHEGDNRKTDFYCSKPNGHLLFPTDFSDNSEQAFLYLKNNLVSSASKITIIHVLESKIMEDRDEEYLHKSRVLNLERLNRMKNDLANLPNLEVEVLLKTGFAITEILKTIVEKQITLVVMGAHGRGFIMDQILGSTTRSVIEESKVNHLIVPFHHDKNE